MSNIQFLFIAVLSSSDKLLREPGNLRPLSRLAVQSTPRSKERLQHQADIRLAASLLLLGDLLRDDLLHIVQAHGLHLAGILVQNGDLLFLVLLEIGSLGFGELFRGFLRVGGALANQRQELQVGLDGRGGSDGVVGFGDEGAQDV